MMQQMDRFPGGAAACSLAQLHPPASNCVATFPFSLLSWHPQTWRHALIWIRQTMTPGTSSCCALLSSPPLLSPSCRPDHLGAPGRRRADGHCSSGTRPLVSHPPSRRWRCSSPQPTPKGLGRIGGGAGVHCGGVFCTLVPRRARQLLQQQQQQQEEQGAGGTHRLAACLLPAAGGQAAAEAAAACAPGGGHARHGGWGVCWGSQPHGSPPAGSSSRPGARPRPGSTGGSSPTAGGYRRAK